MKETEKISVLNYNENRVSVSVAPDKNYSFEPSVDGVTPTVIPMTIDEIRYANNSAAFKNGLLFFDPKKEEEVYEELNITNWKDILSNKDIEDILVRPTYDGLSKIIAINNISVFERVRAMFHKLKQEGDTDISVRVEQIIDTRYSELSNKKIHSEIVLTKKDVPEVVNSQEVDELKAQNAAMQEQMVQMQKMIEQMMKAQSSSTEKIEEKKEPVKKTSGRPKKTS